MPETTQFTKKPLTHSPGNQPYGMSKTTQFSIKNAVTLSIGNESVESLQTMGYSQKEAADFVNYGFWKFMTASFTERHAEGHHLLTSVADSFTLYTTGAMPIQISMNGYLYTTKDQDHRMDFVDFYHNRLRGTMLRKKRFVIVLSMKDTLMRLRIQSINLSSTSRMQDWTPMSLQGVGFSYTVRGMSTGRPAPEVVADADPRGTTPAEDNAPDTVENPEVYIKYTDGVLVEAGTREYTP